MVRDLDLDLGWGHGHNNIYTTCRTSSLPNHVTVASRTTEIRPLEYREIWTYSAVWTLVIAFPEGNSKIGLRQAIVQVPYYHRQPSLLSWAPRKNGGGDRPRKVHFSQLLKLRDLDLDLRSGRGHTDVHMWSRSTHTPNYMQIGKTFCGRTDLRTDGRMDTTSNSRSIRSSPRRWPKIVKQQYLLHMSLQYGELRLTGGWHRFVSFVS